MAGFCLNTLAKLVIVLITLRSSCLARLMPASFNPCVYPGSILEQLIECSNPKNPQRAQDIFAIRSQAIPGMSAVDLIVEVCRLNNNAGETMWTQLMNEFHPDDAVIIDKNTYDCLKALGLTNL